MERYFSEEEEEDRFAPVVEPNLYDPLYSAEEMIARRAERDERRQRELEMQEGELEMQEEGEHEGEELIPAERKNSTWYCTCGQCKACSEERDSFCCNEFNRAQPLLEELHLRYDAIDLPDEVVCVTNHEDLANHTNRGILTTFFRSPRINWSKNSVPEMPDGTLSNRQFRLVGYRLVLEWLLRGEKLGHGIRVNFPSCLKWAIRSKYPSETGIYTEFREFEEEIEGEDEDVPEDGDLEDEVE